MSSNQVYSSTSMAANKIFIDQRVTALENTLIGPAIPGRLGYFTGTSTSTITSSPFSVSGNNLVLPVGGIVNADIVNPVAPLPGQNWVTIAGVNIGTDAPSPGIVSIGAPIVAVDANGLKLTGTTLAAELADAINPGIVSTTTQTFAGNKAFANGILTNSVNITTPFNPLVIGLTAGPITIGQAAQTTTFNTIVDVANIDRTGTIAIADTNTTALNLGRVGINTTVLGTLVANNVDFANIDHVGAITIGSTLATSLALGRAAITTSILGTADIASIDRAGTITVGGTNSTGITIGRSGQTTTVLGTLGAANFDRAGTIIIGGTLQNGISMGRSGQTVLVLGSLAAQTIDQSVAMTIGGTVATSLTLGRVGINTTVLGTLVSATSDLTTIDHTGAMTMGGTSATSLTLGRAAISTSILGTADVALIDRAGTIGIGLTSATALAIGRTGVATSHMGTQSFVNGLNTDLVQARTSVTMVVGTNAAGLTLAPTNGTILVDQATTGGSIGIGTTLATGIFIGRAGLSTTIQGPIVAQSSLSIGTSSITAFATSNGDYNAAGALPATANYLRFNMILINNMISMSWRPLTVGIMCTSTGTITINPAIPAEYRPTVTTVCSAMCFIGTDSWPARITILTTGFISFDVQDGPNVAGPDFVNGTTVSINAGGLTYSTI